MMEFEYENPEVASYTYWENLHYQCLRYGNNQPEKDTVVFRFSELGSNEILPLKK